MSRTDYQAELIFSSAEHMRCRLALEDIVRHFPVGWGEDEAHLTDGTMTTKQLRRERHNEWQK